MKVHDANTPASTAVGIGASAGGVEALCALLDHYKSGHENAAFFVVMHLGINRSSHLAEILARHTTMPVVNAEHDRCATPSTLYVMQPGQVMTVHDGRIVIVPQSEGEPTPTVIDRLFNSIAIAYNERSIGIVLSGTGTDGALGLKAIKDRGGLTIAQGADGSGPLFPGMPQSAIAAGVIDEELSIEGIALRLTEAIYCSDARNALANDVDAEKLNDQRLAICTLLRAKLGHDFSGYKTSTFYRRVQRRMQVLRIEDIEKYVTFLDTNPDEAIYLFRDLLISVTSFFRDKEAFESLEKTVIPELFEGKTSKDEVRIWVPGCATGEEAYSLGVLLLEHIERLGVEAPQLRIFATDIDERAIHIARRGRYPSVLLDAVSPERRAKFFDEDRDNFTVIKSLRSICTFSAHNALRDPPFSRMDLISCRNLLIYLGPTFQDRVFPTFHYALRPNGFLFVGVAEGATQRNGLFAPISRAHRIFRRMANVGSHPLPAFPKNTKSSVLENPYSARSSGEGKTLPQQVEARILQAFSPPHVVVNAAGNVLFYSNRVNDYLHFAAGSPSTHLLTNIRRELRSGLRRALADAVASCNPLDLAEVSIACDDGIRRVNIRIEPFASRSEPNLFLVIFHDRGRVSGANNVAANVSEPVVEQLEQELHETREHLHSTREDFEIAIEELRVANEELMSVNEELQSSNEELETSKEELQSINEEMQTVNGELARNVDALNQSNSDLRGLLESTQIATIFLDRRFSIRSYTQAATEIFALIPSDIGRSIIDLASYLEDFDLAQSLRTTIATHAQVQRSIGLKDGSKQYLMRTLPYDGVTDSTGGAVMTFVDISPLMRADARHKVMIGELNHRVRNMLAVVSAMAAQTLGPHLDAGELRGFTKRIDAIARSYRLLTNVDWSPIRLDALLIEELSAASPSERFDLDGPVVRFAPREALALGMIFHELATNAVKYGALSNELGSIRVKWHSDDADGSLHIHWAEKNGPRVESPNHRGFGTLLVERQLAYELSGRSDASFNASGFTIALWLPKSQYEIDPATPS